MGSLNLSSVWMAQKVYEKWHGHPARGARWHRHPADDSWAGSPCHAGPGFHTRSQRTSGALPLKPRDLSLWTNSRVERRRTARTGASEESAGLARSGLAVVDDAGRTGNSVGSAPRPPAFSALGQQHETGDESGLPPVGCRLFRYGARSNNRVPWLRLRSHAEAGPSRHAYASVSMAPIHQINAPYSYHPAAAKEKVNELCRYW
jgi:hypothetical protein